MPGPGSEAALSCWPPLCSSLASLRIIASFSSMMLHSCRQARASETIGTEISSISCKLGLPLPPPPLRPFALALAMRGIRWRRGAHRATVPAAGDEQLTVVGRVPDGTAVVVYFRTWPKGRPAEAKDVLVKKNLRRKKKKRGRRLYIIRMFG